MLGYVTADRRFSGVMRGRYSSGEEKIEDRDRDVGDLD